MKRRNVLLGGAVAAGALGVGGYFFGSRVMQALRTAVTGGVTGRPIDNIKHVVVLMLENRSFDNLLGKLKPKSDQFDGLSGTETNPDLNYAPVCENSSCPSAIFLFAFHIADQFVCIACACAKSYHDHTYFPADNWWE